MVVKVLFGTLVYRGRQMSPCLVAKSLGGLGTGNEKNQKTGRHLAFDR